MIIHFIEIPTVLVNRDDENLIADGTLNWEDTEHIPAIEKVRIDRIETYYEYDRPEGRGKAVEITLFSGEKVFAMQSLEHFEKTLTKGNLEYYNKLDALLHR